MKLKVTNTQTGKNWIEENSNHSWSDLALEIIEFEKSQGRGAHIVYCDIEGLAQINDDWYLLDECGCWVYVPTHYQVAELKKT